MMQREQKILLGQWYRTCQECGNKQVARKPDSSKELTDSYRNSKCRKCRSEALDYGSEKSAPTVPAMCRNCGETFNVRAEDVQRLVAVDASKDPIEFECCLKGSLGGPT